MRPTHLHVKADAGLEGHAMLLMIEKPRSTHPERARVALARAAMAAITTFDRIVMWPFRVGENRRLLHALAAMSDHDLRDIGLARGDLRDATALPAATDPTRFLAARRSTCRHG